MSDLKSEVTWSHATAIVDVIVFVTLTIYLCYRIVTQRAINCTGGGN